MKKNDVWDESVNPDGISNILEGLSKEVWEKGYYQTTDDGIWYELYVNEQIKKYYPKIDLLKNPDDKETFGSFHNIMLEHYEDYNQITFFVPSDEKKYTLDELTDILI